MQYQEIEWQEEFSTGIAIVDKAHRQLFSIVRRLMELSAQKEKRRWACEEGIKFFKGYTLRHFAEEEEYMRSAGYHRYELHKRIHDTLREKTLPALERELTETDYSPEAVQHFLGICLGWLTGHIMAEDRAITGRVAPLWSQEQNIETIALLENAVIQTVKDIFGLNMQLISEHYAGEGLGRAVGYQLTCTGEDGSGLRAVLLIEEKLMLKTVGRMIGMTFSRPDELVLSAARELAHIIIHRVGGCFQAAARQYDAVTEGSMSREALQLHFENRFPLYSLLFDTGEGHVAFCIDRIEAAE